MTTIDLRTEYYNRRSVWSDIVDHLPYLHETVKRYPKAVVLELGVRWATSTAALLAAAEEVDGHVWSVDVEQPRYPAWWHETGRWTLTIGNDIDADVMAAQPTELDVLFIDTIHTYQHTLEELRLWVPRVKPGGVVLNHDTELSGAEVVRGFGPQPPFPVAKALDDYCAESGHTWTNRPGCYGLGVIEIPRRD